MKRFLIFTLLFPPIALFVFTAPDLFAKRIPTLESLMPMVAAAYLLAIIPAWLLAALDRALSAKPTYLRMAGTTVAAALMGDAIASFLWNGLREFWPALMAGLVGAFPAAVCSWLSGRYKIG